ncbi:hypothetical protein CC79DRAFT_1346226 [Sarocladium strictum]
MSNTYTHHFSDRNIPFGIGTSEIHHQPQAVTRLGDSIIFLGDCQSAGTFDGISDLTKDVLSQTTLNAFAALGVAVRRQVRNALQTIFQEKKDSSLEGWGLPAGSWEMVDEVVMHMPFMVCDFVDFSCSLHHVKNAGRIIINDARPPPAFFNLPIGYQGRASSIVVSGTDIHRPNGQYRDKTASNVPEGSLPSVVYGPSRACDYEMEFAAVVGKPLPMNEGVKATEVDEYIFGFVLLNDWSARDIQGFEMTPLGPLNGKNFGTTISPWVITPEALSPFKTTGPEHTLPETSIPPYLQDPQRQTHDITMQVEITTLDSDSKSTVVCRSKLQSLYWSVRQMIAHVASAGSALRTGDVMATGTVTGDGEGAMGCLLEVTDGGRKPLLLQDGSERRFLEDGDVVRITAVAGGEGDGVGFGECVGRLVARR